MVANALKRWTGVEAAERRIAELEIELSKTKAERDKYRNAANGFVDFSVSRSNLGNWKALQERGYFENHPNHRGTPAFSSGETAIIERYKPLSEIRSAAVIGCGYGRDVAEIAPHVGHVYGIDVNDLILQKAVTFLQRRGVLNFTPVLAERYAETVPGDLDLVFGFVVFQHLTRALTRDYFANLGAKLSANGVFIGQFLETTIEDETILDARLEDYEPSVSWSVMQLHRLAWMTGLKIREVVSHPVSGGIALWHWACLERRPPVPNG